MTTTDFDSAVDHALLISYDWEPACEGQLEPKCGLPAQVILYLRCSCFWMVSWRCRDHDRNNINYMGPTVTHYCIQCGCKLGKVERWEELVVREVPL